MHKLKIFKNFIAWIKRITPGDLIQIVIALVALYISFQMIKVNSSIEEINQRSEIFFNLQAKSFKTGVVYPLGENATFNLIKIDYIKKNVGIAYNNFSEQTIRIKLAFNESQVVGDHSFLLIELNKSDSTATMVIKKAKK